MCNVRNKGFCSLYHTGWFNANNKLKGVKRIADKICFGNFISQLIPSKIRDARTLRK